VATLPPTSEVIRATANLMYCPDRQLCHKNGAQRRVAFSKEPLHNPVMGY